MACSPDAEYYREIGGAELANLVRTWFDRVRWWQMPPGTRAGAPLIHTYWGWGDGGAVKVVFGYETGSPGHRLGHDDEQL